MENKTFHFYFYFYVKIGYVRIMRWTLDKFDPLKEPPT
jgi:hypothetical protein